MKAKLPGCLHYLVTTFFHPPVVKPRTTLVPPILRPLVLSARPEEGEHLLVYQTSTSDAALLDRLRATGLECRIYGVRRGIRAEERDGNLRFMPFSDEGFVDDLRTARGVVANGGFTLLGEAVYLRRPLLSVPVRKQFEQVLNARYLEREGYGIAAEEVTGEVLGQFLERLPDLRRNLEAYHQDGNRALFSRLDELLAAAVARDGIPEPEKRDPGRSENAGVTAAAGGGVAALSQVQEACQGDAEASARNQDAAAARRAGSRRPAGSADGTGRPRMRPELARERACPGRYPWYLRRRTVGGRWEAAMGVGAMTMDPAGDVFGLVDSVIRQHGVHPNEQVRSLLAAAAEQRMRERGEAFGIAVPRAMAALVTAAQRR